MSSNVKAFLTAAALMGVSLAMSGCSGTDYLADVTKDTHSGCFSAATNYLGFTESVTYIHLGDNSAAVNASPSCAGITQSAGTLPSSAGSGTIPASPAPVGKTTSP